MVLTLNANDDDDDDDDDEESDEDALLTMENEATHLPPHNTTYNPSIDPKSITSL